MISYREYQPSARLRRYVECFWTHEVLELTTHRVLPDGCADIVLTRTGKASQELIVVGTMTHAHSFVLQNATTVGVRFRPGMLPFFLDVTGVEIADRTVPLEEIWRSRATDLNQQLAGCSAFECIAHLETLLTDHLRAQHNGEPALSSTQRVLSWVEQQHGDVRVDDLANLAGLSTRHFRRVCLELTGLTPKQLCRAIRFRYSSAQLLNASRGNWITVAVNGGYYDQAHFINEFRAFSGMTPSQYLGHSK